MSKVLAVIPARFGSTRFPGKPLASIGGVPMILRVYRNAAGVRGIDKVLVATDDRRILDVVEGDGGSAILTSRSHRSGTSRVAEVAARLSYGIVLNIQGDEPLLPRRGVEKLVETMRSDPRLLMGTLATPSSDKLELRSSDVVKVVRSAAGDALYFSRSPIPHSSDGFLKHIGVYAYRRSFLLRFGSLRRGPLEKQEGLEQLRALENGISIRVVICRSATVGVDRPADIKRVEKRLERS